MGSLCRADDGAAVSYYPLGHSRAYQCVECLERITWAQHLENQNRCNECAAKCAICGVGFMPCEIPYRGLVSDIPYHAECYREHYAAIEYDPIEAVQPRHREP